MSNYQIRYGSEWDISFKIFNTYDSYSKSKTDYDNIKRVRHLMQQIFGDTFEVQLVEKREDSYIILETKTIKK